MSRALVWCLLANVIGGTTFVAMQFAHDSGLPTVTFCFLRTVMSTLLFAIACATRRVRAPRFTARDWFLLCMVAIPGFALPVVMGVRGVALSTPAMGSILALLEPIAIVPLCLLFLHERIPAPRLAGMALGLTGALLVIVSEAPIGAGGASSHRLGNVLLAVQAGMWAIYTVAAKPLVDRHDALSISAWATAIGTLALGLLAPLEWAPLRPAALDGVAAWLGLEVGPSEGAAIAAAGWAALPSMLYLAIFGSFVAVLLWNTGLKGVSATTMAAFIFVQPAVGLLIDFARGKPAPTSLAWVGLTLIAAAVWFVSRESTTPSARRPSG
ncbi:MAG: DMT family transporter [Planctomycetes bacterium]|nr:DMT family transporter [Planctomycetota bacterium]